MKKRTGEPMRGNRGLEALYSFPQYQMKDLILLMQGTEMLNFCMLEIYWLPKSLE